jgi:RimJ/RimL family protein N-acetyltransferase
MLLDETLIGVIDCKLSDDEEGLAFIGLLLMAERYADQSVAALALRMLERWLSRSYNVRRIETSVPAHNRTALRFWSDQGFSFTGEQHRRELGERSPRFLHMARDVIEFAK